MSRGWSDPLAGAARIARSYGRRVGADSDDAEQDGPAVSPWRMSWRADPAGAEIADRHYNRQAHGSPQFVPPGRCLVLVAAEGEALWVTSWPFAKFVKHEWAGAWINSTFRRDSGDVLASDLIRAAVAVTRWRWPDVPDLGMVTFVDPSKVRRKRDPGRCFLRAGFRPAGQTKGGLLAFRLAPDEMPAPQAPVPRSGALFPW